MAGIKPSKTFDCRPQGGTVRCLNCHSHFQQLRPHVKEVRVSKHFLREAPSFNINLVLDCEHQHFTILHKLEETIDGNHIFRALHKGKHIVYAIDKKHRLVFLRAFKNLKSYGRFLENKKKILEMLEE